MARQVEESGVKDPAEVYSEAEQKSDILQTSDETLHRGLIMQTFVLYQCV